MTKPILKALTNNPQIERFVPYMLDNTLQVEKHFPGTEKLPISGYQMEDFKVDNHLVMTWFSQLQQDFDKWRSNQHLIAVAPVNLVATGSRSFNASYTESDLECAIVSENFEDFLDFCQFLNSRYSNGHNFIALKTLAGLPLLIIKGEAGFCCPELSKLYPGKSLPQLEVTFRHPGVHQIIQEAGLNFFASLNPDELESYVFNKRYIELMIKNTPNDATFEGESLKKVLEAFKAALSAALKCLPSGVLQNTPAFNKEVFANTIKAKPLLSDGIASGMTFYQLPSSNSINTVERVNTQKL
jgi:hypothetical protein